ncbi:flagellar biosynthesis protein FliS [Fervidobacterium sp. SC_NGM5_O18]|jgi:flagellar protein FliS|uniref:Flagellar secretion chaperone FliS n=2 Tax=Fervidobacterium pennivorans TaxID=93466 RepID=A0A172T4F7_FERPE|nr:MULTISPECIES: flagellar export chaperone FliS [Fervidobacterium]PHJ13086.1 flagellar biosynthesis protein FliS [Fervidobacterium sp. SC_NGM5_O18]AFG35141.1 flagellar biosynthetic protein FliS [Fervidobacterium pennivorans DSM 9078]ANE41915.1 flagellar biosynthesis protein FliS [Fervidobacterium pennivorans]MDM7320780.1 flagellar export chaperone FliS [Fervidobacterium sp.]NPU89870.1 flagellar export chaperone FliS [Fervidobacterium sp.]
MDYIEQMVLTASPAKLIELLLQKAISVIDEAKNYIDEKDYNNANAKIVRAQDIVMELNLALDMEKGGEIAKNLRALYNYMYRTLVEANIKKDKKMLDDVKSLLEDLLSTWREAMKLAGSTASQIDVNKPRINLTY